MAGEAIDDLARREHAVDERCALAHREEAVLQVAVDGAGARPPELGDRLGRIRADLVLAALPRPGEAGAQRARGLSGAGARHVGRALVSVNHRLLVGSVGVGLLRRDEARADRHPAAPSAAAAAAASRCDPAGQQHGPVNRNEHGLRRVRLPTGPT